MRTTSLTASLIAVGGALVSGLCFAAAPKVDAPAEIKKVLEERYPQVKVVDVKPAQIAGLYEVFTGDAIIYASANGDFLVAGPLMDTKEKSNLTAKRLDERNSIDFASLPLDLAIKTVKGDGRRTIAVFADPDCPYCKELEHSINTFDNVTMYTFLYPLASLHPDAPAKAHTIWCASDRSQAWTQWMIDGKPATASEGCKDDPIDELQQLGKTLRIASTPVVFFADGQRVGGTLTAEQLKVKFDAVEAQTSSKGSTSRKAAGGPAGSAN
ncbi:MAG: DsbC family protein [Gammaproteobacteria bacterium]